MCRLLAYMESPTIIDQLLYQPKNSLVNQSVHARESEEPLNGDGFAIPPAHFVVVDRGLNARIRPITA